MPLKILTLNCRGLHKNLKRRHIFSLCIKYDICCLQETHITESLYKQWKNEWKGYFYFSKGTSNSNGLITLIKPNIILDEEPKLMHSEQRILAIEFTQENDTYLIVNIYGPNKKKEKLIFFDNLLKYIDTYSNMDFYNIIVCGDFNTVLSNALDIISGAPHDNEEVNTFNSFIKTCNLYDVWRSLNPETNDFTWNSQTPFIARRLDFILCSQIILERIKTIDHNVVTGSDHKAVCIEVSTEIFIRGPGIWKFNNSLLNDIHYLEKINTLIDIFLIDNTHKNPALKWELLKSEIKSISTQYCTLKNQNKFSEEITLKNKINDFNRQLLINPNDKTLQDQLKILKQNYEIHSLYKTKGAQIRSRIRYIEEGERNTKYFLGLEKARGSLNTIQELKQENNSIKDPEEILGEIKLFYQDLYSKDSDVDENIESINTFLYNSPFPVLNHEEQVSLENDITIKELGNALSKLNNDSSPGSDGLTTEFYKAFWNKLKIPLFESLNYALETGELSISQRRGIFTLIHKGGNLDKNNLSNWRPISLLNTDYKIFSKIIALRLQLVINKIINPLQKGFIKGRNISEIIRLIDDSILIARQNKLPGLMASVDFQKAFDSVNKKAILNAMQTFNFGPIMRNIVSILLNNSESCVRNGNWFSSYFKCERGIRQGCCVSPYLFLLVAEILSIKLRNTNEIKGISLPSKNIFLSKVIQYADDTTLFLKDEEELESALKTIEIFGKFSGLKLNRRKSLVLPFGGFSCRNKSVSNVIWLQSHDVIKVLGIYFSGEKEASNIDLNWLSKIDNMVRTINTWMKRNISIYGKIILCKTFILSKINYIIQSLSLPEEVLAVIDRIMFNFIWKKNSSSKKAFERIKRTTLCQDVATGGLNMISVKDQQKVFQIKWIISALHLENPLSRLANSLTTNIGGIDYISKSRLQNPISVFGNSINSDFWQRAACTWSFINYNMNKTINNAEEALYQPIFLNSSIQYRNNPLFFGKWIKGGFLLLRDLYDNSGLINENAISKTLQDYPGFKFDFNALINAIPTELRDPLRLLSKDIIDKAKSLSSTAIKDRNKLLDMKNKELRNVIISMKINTKCNEVFWKRNLDFDISDHYVIAHKATKESRLRLLHFKILHNIYPTNILLHKMKVKTSPLCQVCQVPDFIEHFFVDCVQICWFWEFISSFIKSNTNKHINISRKNILLGITYLENKELNKREVNFINFTILLGKLCISKFKYGTLKNLTLIFECELALRRRHVN